MAIKPGHDGSVAVIRDHRLVLSLESEKDSFPRHTGLLPNTMLDVAEHVGDIPDVVALGGWRTQGAAGQKSVGAGYHGVAYPERRVGRFFGKRVEFFSSSHVRSHIMMAIGMAPRPAEAEWQAVLVWEGVAGAFYLVDSQFRIRRTVSVMTQPGMRYAFLFALADPTFPDAGAVPDLDVSGKLMALAAYGDRARIDGDVKDVVDRILGLETIYPAPKGDFRDTPVYNAGVTSEITKIAASALSDRIFEEFATVAEEALPPGLPLRVSGGCGLNCEWNARWMGMRHFSSVFVPPCANDSGSALGTAIDVLATHVGDPYVEWDVYAGLDFDWDAEPDPVTWRRRPLDLEALSRAIAEGRVVAWVQGRWEMGPRALGNRSILAEPFDASTKNRLNAIKDREDYRPIAPCCRIEDLAEAFCETFPDPHMLYFRRVRAPELAAVTHVDGTARAQTVSRTSNRPLHALLSAFARHRGMGVLCNTSLNFKANGFINRMSDLIDFCESRGLDDMVVGNVWFERDRGDG